MNSAWILREEGLKNIYAEADGFYVWTPALNSGSLTEHALRTMADYLQAKNAAWQWVIDNDSTIGAPRLDKPCDRGIGDSVIPSNSGLEARSQAPSQSDAEVPHG